MICYFSAAVSLTLLCKLTVQNYHMRNLFVNL